MQTGLNKSLNKKQVTIKLLPKLSLRTVTQSCVVLIMLIAIWQLYDFYSFVMGNDSSQFPYRPPVGEAFMPLGAVVALIAWIDSGVFDPVHPAGLVILVASWLTAWIFRRALCSWICPIGTLVQYLGKLGERVMGRNLSIPNLLEWLLITLKYCFGVYLLVSMFLIMPSSEAVSFLQIPYYVVSDLKMFIMWIQPGMYLTLLLVAFLILNFLFKSFWCRYLCPYGAVLGIFSLLSPFSLNKKAESCVQCGRCNKLCPNQVNVKDVKKVVWTAECTGCTSCVNSCPKTALQLKFLGWLPVPPLAFSLGFIFLFFGIIGLAKTTGHWESSITTWDYQSIWHQWSQGQQ